MKIPTNLKHKPVIAVENYASIDGKYQNETDAVGLSIGFAQWWNGDLSAKIWRYSDKNKWSRQSEELPLHRVFDLALLIVECCASISNIDEEISEIASFPTLQGNEEKITMCEWDGKPIPKINIDRFVNMLKEEEKSFLKERFSALANLLKGMGY